jgi:hypothetical protein
MHTGIELFGISMVAMGVFGSGMRTMTVLPLYWMM